MKLHRGKDRPNVWTLVSAGDRSPMATSTTPETARGLHGRGKCVEVRRLMAAAGPTKGARAPGRPTAARLLARRDKLRPREPRRAGTRPRRRGHGRAALARRRVPSTVFAHFAGGGALSAGPPDTVAIREEKRRLRQISLVYLFVHVHGGPYSRRSRSQPISKWKKSIWPPSTFWGVWVSTLIRKIGFFFSFIFSNRLLLLPEWFHRWFWLTWHHVSRPMWRHIS